MEPNKSQNIHSLAKFTDAQFLKMVTQLLLSVSVFSFFFSHSSLFSFLHSLNFYLSTFPYQLFTHTIDKKCIFLLCNGLLVFLAKYSGFIRFLSLSNPQDDQYYSKNLIIDGSQSEFPMSPMKELILETKEVAVESIESTESVIIKEENEDQYYFTNQRESEPEPEPETEKEKIVLEDNKEQEQGDEFVISKEEEEEEENALVLVQEDEEEQTWSEFDFVEEEEEEEEEVGNGMLSTEELNKKFDEFIRRMKEELRIEAQQQQLIMV